MYSVWALSCLCCKELMQHFANKVGQYWFGHMIPGNEVDLMIFALLILLSLSHTNIGLIQIEETTHCLQLHTIVCARLASNLSAAYNCYIHQDQSHVIILFLILWSMIIPEKNNLL